MVTERMAEETPAVEETEIENQQQQTQMETVETLRVQLSELQEQLKKREQDVSGLNRTLQQRAAELKKQTDITNRIDGLEDTLETLAAAIATGRSTDDIEPEEKNVVVSQLRQQRQQREAQRKQEDALQQQQEYNQKADALYARAQKAFTGDDDSLERIEDLLRDGRMERAETRVTKAESSNTSPKGEKVDSEEQRIERLAQERLKKVLEERGLLEEFSTTPSGTGGEEGWLDRWNRGLESPTPQNVEKARRLLGL